MAICSILPTRSISTFLRTIDKSRHTIRKDGNCFYRALAIAEYKDEEFHKTIRYTAMNHIQSNADDYIPFFGDAPTFYQCVNANKSDGVWNTDISDITSNIISTILDVYLVIYDYSDVNDSITVYTFGDPSNKQVELLRVDDTHYDLLVAKSKQE